MGLISTSTDLKDYEINTNLISKFKEDNKNIKLTTTLGVHPTHSQQVFEGEKCNKNWDKVEEYFEEMRSIFKDPPKHLVAIGECGLDYARLFCSPKDCQIEFFQRHFDLLAKLEPSKRMPMFLHMRDCLPDFIEILRKNREIFPGGVVHSFTGSIEEATELLEFSDDLFIGINGCSLREEQGIEVAKMLPLDRIMIESDAPYCQMRPSHASFKYLNNNKFDWPIPSAQDKSRHSPNHPVKGRNEPSETRRVLRVLAEIRGMDEVELGEILFKNTLKLFPQFSEL